jgi:hypothetical protein
MIDQPAPQSHTWRHEIGDHVTIAIDPTGEEFEIKSRGIDLFGWEFYGLQDYYHGTPFTFNLGYNCLRAVQQPPENIRRDLINDWR